MHGEPPDAVPERLEQEAEHQCHHGDEADGRGEAEGQAAGRRAHQGLPGRVAVPPQVGAAVAGQKQPLPERAQPAARERRRLRQLVVQLPASALVLETDAPDLTVASHQGGRNSPEYLPEVLSALAEVRGESREQVAIYTSANARQVFNLDR